MKSPHPTSAEPSRRRFLKLAAGSVGVTMLLEACAPAPATPKPTAAPAPAASGAAGPLPTYIATSNAPKPDFQNSDPRISPGYLGFPKEPPKSWSGAAPGSGGTMNVLMAGYFPPPAPRDVNATWKAVEKELNSSVTMTIIPGADYRARMQVVMAGSDMPDVVHVSGPVADLISLQFLQAQMADLTPYLSGDAAKDYPNLAAVPGYAYKGAGGVFGDRLYGVPIHRYLPAFWFFRNTDIWDAEIGADVVPKDAADFKKILQQLNRPQENRWAIGNSGPVGSNMWGLTGFLEMFGAPNVWASEPSGKLIRSFETEQFKAAIAFMNDLVNSGLYHPDTQTLNGTQGRDAFIAGKYAVSSEAFGNGFADFWRRGLRETPPRHYNIVTPFSSVAGQPPRHFLTGGTIAYNIVKKGSADRVKETLRIMDYLAAPFGTQEDMLLTYGLRDQDHALDASSNPIPNQAGLANSQYVPWQYLSHRPFVWYQPDLPGYVQASYEAEQTLVNVGVTDPTRGLHSASQSRKGVAADQTFYDGVADILWNRRPISDYDGLVAEWRTSAGDVIRKEFEDEIAGAK